jgi:PKD repeat protein
MKLHSRWKLICTIVILISCIVFSGIASADDGTIEITDETPIEGTEVGGDQEFEFTVEYDTSGEDPGYISVSVGEDKYADVDKKVDLNDEEGSVEITIDESINPDWEETAVNVNLYPEDDDDIVTSLGDDTIYYEVEEGDDGGNTPPDAEIDVSATEATVGEEVEFDASGSTDDTGIDVYRWDFDDGTEDNGEEISHSFDEPGTYTIEIEVEDEDGATDTDKITVEVKEKNEPPEAVIDASATEVSVGEEVEFDASESTDDTGIDEYHWQIEGEWERRGEYVEHSFDEPGTYTVELGVVDEQGQGSDPDEITIEVKEKNEPPEAVIDASATEVSVGEEVEFDASESTDDTGIDVYRWDFDDGTEDNGEEISHSFDEPGTYTIEIEVEDEDGATDTDKITVEVEVINRPPSVSFDVSTGTAMPQVDQVVRFDASPTTHDNSIEEYVWTIDDDTRVDGEIVTHEFKNPGTHTVELYVEDSNGLSDSQTREITVGKKISVDIDCSVTESNTVECFANHTTDSDNKIDSFEWDLDDGSGSEASGESIKHTYDNVDSAEIKVTATGRYGNSDTATQTVSFGDAPTPKISYSPTSPLVGEDVSFDAGSSNDEDGRITEFDWNIKSSEDIAKEGGVVTHTFNESGKHVVQLIVTDNDGKTVRTSESIEVRSPAFTDMSIRTMPEKPDDPTQLTFSTTSQLGNRPIKSQLYLSTPDEVTITGYNLPPDWSTGESATVVSDEPLSGGESEEIQMDIVATANGTYEVTGEVVYTIGEDGKKIGPISTEPVKMCVGPCDEQTEDSIPGFDVTEDSILGFGVTENSILGLSVFVAIIAISSIIAIVRQ